MEWYVRLILAIILGAIRGFCDVLPIEASAHLRFADELAQTLSPLASHEPLFLAGSGFQIGVWVALVSVLMPPLSDEWRRTQRKQTFIGSMTHLGGHGVIATLVTAVIAIILTGIFALLPPVNDNLVAFALFGNGGILLFVSARGNSRLPALVRSIDSLGARDFALLGLAQAFAIIPGISRISLLLLASTLLGLKWSETLKLILILSLFAIPIAAGNAMTTESMLSRSLGDFALFGCAAVVAGFVARGVIEAALRASLYAHDRLSYYGLYCVTSAVFYIAMGGLLVAS